MFDHFHKSALTVYNNAAFEPNTVYFTLDNITNVGSQMACACLCFANQRCLVVTYFGLVQSCVLSLAALEDGTLRLMTIDMMASVLIFENKILPAPSTFTSQNETVYGVWNTVASGDSSPSSTGLSNGDYAPGQDPTQVFDDNPTTKYINFGVCNSTVGTNIVKCGITFCTADSYPLRDPNIITVEGSNQPSSLLTFGSSWTLIYNGSSGLNNSTARYTCGITQWFSNNSIWYTSYRILTVSKMGGGNFVHYSELQLWSF